MDRNVAAMRLATSSLSGQETSETVQSLDVSVQGMNRQHFTKNEILAMQTTSILDLLYKDSKGDNRRFPEKANGRICSWAEKRLVPCTRSGRQGFVQPLDA
jgi:hypothetical protein